MKWFSTGKHIFISWVFSAATIIFVNFLGFPKVFRLYILECQRFSVYFLKYQNSSIPKKGRKN